MTTTTAWAHLPNAKHIDRVLSDVRAHPQRWGAARDAARDAAWDAARGAALDAARGACAALIAWDDAGDLLDLPVDTVRLLAGCGHHSAVLMLPACIALNGEKT